MTDYRQIVEALTEFINYVDSFYNAKSGIYPIEGMTDKMVLNAVQKYIKANASEFCGDSLDRERVRDIILEDNNLEWSV